ncbi:Npun_F0494 family protein [Merismopedia glauca]|uniref:MarR family transcriptional regulator n=1 Tax=Merismopedia glauca CCAP 1448/3 TaxID=1296344 RepID=A0A2T1CA70_9CYAN|nr:Npun_F0494 family protein [Merismopedia glauca]PSB05170.1 hypothetical protein C7B64_00555 [Merismopedia glauca CCAP 1448/3]
MSSNQEPIKYRSSTIKRAKRALNCSPFCLDLFIAMRSHSVPLQTIADELGVKNNYTTHPITELRVENSLMWLIQVGILRREVDGQGITDSFRLTPLGRELVFERESKSQILVNPAIRERISDFMTRWFRIWM